MAIKLEQDRTGKLNYMELCASRKTHIRVKKTAISTPELTVSGDGCSATRPHLKLPPLASESNDSFSLNYVHRTSVPFYRETPRAEQVGTETCVYT